MFAQIVAPGFRYQLTQSDVLWAGRMVDGEGDADGPEVLWAMTQRFAGLVRRGSFRNFIRAYSQPINPKWYRDGVCCAPGATGCPARRSRSFYGEEPCSESRLRRRARISSRDWDRLPVLVRKTTMAWATARLSNPVPRATDFATPRLVRKKLERDSRKRLVAQKANWFITSPDSNSWGANHVVMKLGSRTATAGAGSLAVGVVGSAALAWALKLPLGL